MSTPWKRHIVVVALYSVLTLLMTMPVISSLTSHVAGQGGDPWQTMWRFEHEWENRDLLRVLGGGEARLVNISVWPWMGLYLLFGQPAAYNLVFLLAFILSGYFMYLLVRHLTRHEAAAFLAGVLYMFLPFHVAHSLGHFGAMQTQWLPLAILLLLMWVKKPTGWRTIGLALAVTLQSWTEHHYALWLAIFGIVFAIFHLTRPSADLSLARRGASPLQGEAGSSSRRMRWIHGIFLSILILVFAFLPWLPTVKLATQGGNNLELGTEQTIRFSADLFSYITPAPWQPIWGGISSKLFGRHFTGNAVEATQFLGFLPLLLLLFFCQHIPRRQKTFWFGVATVFFVISLGPRLHIFGEILPVPLPYALFDSLPVFSAVRAVARAGVMVGLSISVLFGWVLARELKRPISGVIVLALILAEFLFLPVPLQTTKLSRAYNVIARLPGKSLIEIPAATNYAVASQALYASLVHGKEVVGSIALERAANSQALKEVRSLPALRQLLFLRTRALLEDRKDFFDQDLVETLPDVLKYLDVSVIAVHVDSLSAEQRRAIEYFLEERLAWKGEKYDNIVLYRVTDRPGDGIFKSDKQVYTVP